MEGFSYAEMEEVLARVFGARASDARPKLKARYRKLQALGLPRGKRPTRGRKGYYSLDQLCEVALALELAEFGFEPLDVLYLMEDIPIGLLKECNVDREAADHFVMCIFPSLMSRSWLGHHGLQLSFGGRAIISDLVSKSGIPRFMVIDLDELASRIVSAVKEVKNGHN